MVGILIIARLGSTRLKSKHLILCEGKTFIEWLVERFVKQFSPEMSSGNIKLILATSVSPENKQFEKVLAHLPIDVFYGSDDNIPRRQSECAEAHKLDAIISVDGDDILCSTEAARKIYDALPENHNALIKTSGLPLGMNVMGYSSGFLAAAVSRSAGKLETGWGRVFDGTETFDIKIAEHSDNKALRLTLDYEADAKFFREVISALKSRILTISDQQLIEKIIKNRFYEINAGLNEEYMANFNRAQKSDIDSAQGD